MMPLSQIDMVILKEGGSKLQVCGGLQRESDKEPDRAARLYVVIRQGDVIATGPGTCDYTSVRWKLNISVPEGPPTRLQAGPALACGVAIVEKYLAGLEAFSWAQQVDILAQDPTSGWGDPDPIDFPIPQQVVSKQGQLDAAQAIASSLTITPSDGGNYDWDEKVEIRPVVQVSIV
jgi:hypothetical protein